MKLTRILLALGLCMAFATAARAVDTIAVARIVFTNNPANGNTITVNGVVRTFKTSVSNDATEIAIGATAVDTAANYVAQVIYNPYTSIWGTVTTTNVTLTARANFAVTASLTGTWGTVAVTSETVDTFTFTLPLSAEAPAVRTAQGNWLAEALRDYPTIAVPETSIFSAALVGTGRNQTIGGAKMFVGATTLSNANNLITGGAATNLELNRVMVKAKTNNVAQGVYFYDTNSAPVAVLMADMATGYPVLLAVYGGVPYNAFSSVPSPGSLLNAASGDYRYGQLSAVPNVFLGTNRFVQITNTVFVGGVITNAALTNVTVSATAAWIANPSFSGNVVVTNGATYSRLRFSNGTSGADEKQWDMETSTTNLNFYVYADDFSSGNRWFRAGRTGAVVDSIAITSSGTMALSSSGIATLSGSRENFVNTAVFGADMAPPASMSAGLILNDGTAPSADPSAGATLNAVSGDIQYRGSTANGGSGGNRHLHNAAAEVVGTGSDFAFGGTVYARVDFSGQDPEITLPTDGTYLLQATVCVVAGGTANDPFSFKFYNSTDSADIANSEQSITSINASGRTQVMLRNIVTVSASKLVQLYGKNATAARGTVEPSRTLLSYVRLF